MDVPTQRRRRFSDDSRDWPDAYDPYIQSPCPNSVATLIIPNRTAANDPFVVNAIQKAEALWIAGGDQSNHMNFWKGTPVETELNNLIARGAPIGGISAGMNVLSEFLYSALASQGVTSSQALADPFSRYVTLDRDFLNMSIQARTPRRSAFRHPRSHGSRPCIHVPRLSEWMVQHSPRYRH